MQKEKILIVEDNKALSKLLAKKIVLQMNFDVDVAHSLKEAENLLSVDSNYFVALLDLNLPDAPNGEVVDYMVAKKIPSIVLTGNIDNKIRAEILSKNIIDYVYKGNMDDVNYIFSLLERLSKNRNCKVMVVDDSIVTRNEVKKMLQEQMFQVFAAAHGEEALGYMESHKDIKLVLTDLNMPVIDGFELTKKIREDYTKNELSIIAMTAVSEEMVSSRFLKIGANDFINKPFTKEELICRVNNSVEALEYIEKIQDMANTDLLSGVYNRRFFYKTLQEHYSIWQQQTPFALAMIDIDGLKKINEEYSQEAGDLVIQELAQILQESTKGSDIIARVGGEEFALLLKGVKKEDAVAFFVRLRLNISKHAVEYSGKSIHFSVSIGVAFSEEESSDEILNQADMALYQAKKNGKNRVEIAMN